MILHILHDLYQKDQIHEIKRVRLQEACEDYLIKKSDGARDTYGGGSFQRSLKKLEELGFITIIHRGKKDTVIIPNVKKIEYAVQYKDIESLLDKNKNLVQENVEDSILEEIMEEVLAIGLDKIVKSRYSSTPDRSYYIQREFVSKILANVMSRSCEVNVAYHKDTNFEIDKEFIISIANPILEKAKRNVRIPFTVSLEYKGRPEMSEFFRYEPAVYNEIAEYFVKWAKQVHNYDVTQEDKLKVSKGLTYLLSKDALERYNIFIQSAQDCLKLLSTA
jgi:hypothetical protein